ncbi:MAG: hypothetical protein EXQ93_04670 [Alphaproteobacteria bacterium]|nr:hypothetical protein [Alphaproteobacteria bacterium]
MQNMSFYDRTLARMLRLQLMNAAAVLGTAAIASPIFSSKTLAPPIFMDYPFQIGVASGDPTPNGGVLWTRLAPKHLEGGGMPAINVEVEWDVATATNFANIVQKGVAVARPELGHSVHVEVAGLEPNKEYFYRFRAGNEVTPTARTKTAPAVGQVVERMRFGICGCNNYEQGLFTTYRGMAQENCDFIIHTGDCIYEGRDNGNRTPDTLARRHNGLEIHTVVDYRNRYALYKSDPNFLAAHASAPWLITRDDHEVENNHTVVDETTSRRKSSRCARRWPTRRTTRPCRCAPRPSRRARASWSIAACSSAT